MEMIQYLGKMQTKEKVPPENIEKATESRITPWKVGVSCEFARSRGIAESLGTEVRQN